jgi:hypothetical protein
MSLSMDRTLFDTLAAAGLMRSAVRNSLKRYGITSITEFIEKGAVALAHMEDDHGQDLLFQEAGERPEYNIVTMGESRELQRLLAELSSRSMDRAFLDTLAAAGLAGHGLVEQGHGLVEHTVTNALRRNDITSIPEFIEKGEVALAHIADDRAQGHKVYVGDSTIVTLVELQKLQRLLAELSPAQCTRPIAQAASADTGQRPRRAARAARRPQGPTSRPA